MLKSFLFKVKDHRRGQGKRYELGDILLFSILGILSGATSYRKIELFIKTNYKDLDTHFDLEWKSTPAYTTIRSVLQNTDGDELESCFREYSSELGKKEESIRHVAFDGKVLRGSVNHFEDQKAVQLLSAFLSDSRIILAHEEIETKTNEIPTAQELIENLGLSGCLFTFDALHCQEETLKAAVESNNDAIVQVKGNQPTLLKDCKDMAQEQTPDDTYQEPLNKTRNRIESRKVEVFLEPSFTHQDKWSTVKAVIKVVRFRKVFNTRSKSWQETHETAFYVSTTILEAKLFCHVIRQHWGIENRNHYVRDFTLGEDSSRIRSNPAIFARLRSFALNILRNNNITNVSLAIFQNCMDIQHLLRYSAIA